MKLSWNVLFVLGALVILWGCSKDSASGRATLTGDTSCPYARNASLSYSQCRDYADNWYLSQSPATPQRNKAVYDTMNGSCCMFETQRRSQPNAQ